MGQLSIAEGGVVLTGTPSFDQANGLSVGTKPPQAMRLELMNGALDDILKASRNGGKGVHVSFGKTVVRYEEGSLVAFHTIANSICNADPTRRQQVPPVACNTPAYAY